ncbi:uncharacterized protein PV09_07609 [Verruconis gallopava]|uniref:Mediator of RNA polymerase II transcription subunit 11 n=1 Tax=Verruconis gallopava TaxID=253628 RepID=A0A0D2AP07_9PEZI|nr:uncharacterized protein PV09_07609 [Verruconis gallopava]KIW00849.1 hypothetical protein PV09_07609 [Verruconis gallopava]
MDDQQQTGDTSQSSKQTTERIQALAEISKKIPQLLHHAGQAVNALTRNPLPEDAEARDEDGPLAKNKTVFKDNYGSFLQLLTEVTNSLNEEADALVNSKLVPARQPKKGLEGDHITNEGLGNLDVGYLNSRTRDVGLAKEAELVKEMKAHIQKLVAKMQDANGDAMDET